MHDPRPAGDWFGGHIELLSDEPDRRIYRGHPSPAKPLASALLVVEAVGRPGRKPDCARLRHEDRLKERLDGEWAVVPLAFVEQSGALLLHDPGGDIASRLAGPALAIERFLAIAIALATAVSKMHQAGWLHRDIRTGNVLFDAATGTARLTGFGIAVPPGQDPGDEAPTFGTFAYMAPEQTGRIHRRVDQRSDLYSLGVTLYELLTGTLPLTASSPAEWIHGHLARQPAPPMHRRESVPAQLSDIVMKLLGKSPCDRYQSASGLASDLARCLAQWEADRTIRPFPPGAGESPERFRFREGLYGRDAELAQLEAAYADVANAGERRVVLVSGYSGIGKSALIDALRKTLAASTAPFAIGKFDQYKRAEPYTAVAQALQPLVRELLGKTEHDLQAWRAPLQAALGGHGGLIVDLIPDLKHLLGPQPEISELSGTEARARFLRVFRSFIGVFARPGHPLVLFLDDLQWLDTATLDLFRDLATHPDMANLLLIGSYRSNEVEGRPELASLLDELHAQPSPPLDISLRGIGKAQVAQMIADAVKCPVSAVSALSACILDKTGDNPFFIVQFVAALADDGLLVYDVPSRGWGWDLERIRRREIADNIVGLMVERLTRLSEASLHAVTVLACMGSRTPAYKLAIALSASEKDVRRHLEEAIALGLVLRYSSEYAFAHDRVHEAAYALQPDAARSQMHRRIGMLLLNNTTDGDLDDHLFEIVGHLNRGGPISAAQRPHVAALNLRAGRKARASTAYAAACDYLATGRAQLASADERDQRALAYELALEHAECRFLAGGVAEAKAMIGELFTLARTELEIAAANRLKIELHMVSSENDLAVDTAVAALNRLGIPLDAHPCADDVHLALESAWRRFDEHAVRSIAGLPAMTDPLRLMSMRLLADTWPAASFTDFRLAIVVVCNMVTLSLDHGSARSSNQGFALFGLLMGPALGRYREGYRLALDACERAAQAAQAATSRETSRTFNTMALTAAWTQPLEKSAEWSRLAYQKGIEAGDIYFACFSAFHCAIHRFMQGRDLAEDARMCLAYLGFARETGFQDGIALLTTLERTIACLRGQTRSLTDFTGDDFDGAAFEADVRGPRLNVVSQLYWTSMTMLLYLAGQYDAALAASKRFQQGPPGQIHLVRHLEYRFYTGLAAAAAWNSAPEERRPALRAQLDEHYLTIRKWAAESQSRTFTDKHLLLGAEIARIEGRTLEAGQLYERSARAAGKNGFRHVLALAAELAARFYQERGLERIAAIYLHDAIEAYWQWGARAKADQLQRAHPIASRFTADAAEPAPTAMMPLHQFSFADFVKRPSPVNDDFALDRLLVTVMRAVLESTGAQCGALLRLHHSNEVETMASARFAADGVAVDLGNGDAPRRWPEAILRHLVKRGKTLIVDDARGDERFAGEPAVARQGLRSVLCLPIAGFGGQMTVLYLEHNDTPGAFRATRLDILEILATHAAAAIENARLYAELEKREARLRLLVESDVIGILFWDLNGNVTYANDAFLAMTGYDRSDVERGGISWREMTPPEWRTQMSAKLQQLRETGAMAPWEKQYIRKDGTRVPILIGAAMFDEARSGVAFVLDLSDRKAAEQRALDSERRSRELHVELAHANRLATIGQLSDWIAHDVKRPLADIAASGMAALAELAAETPHLDKARDALQRIVGGGMHAAEVLDRTRELVRKVAPAAEAVDINEVAATTISLIAPEAVRKGIAIETTFGRSPMRPTADRVQLQQVMLNLLVNAIDAMSGASEAARTLTVLTDGDHPDGYLIEVRDTGPGFPSLNGRDCFDAFVTTKRGALGMGLSICRSIVEAFGGHIAATSNRPHGAILRVVLPRAATETGAPQGAPPPQ
ncbi:protein kinase [Cupriavidus sp. HPC(L)]|uniref:trifunctional serine/threonine-protein kinase/ATP-binding protein/sensor histidine kinase n=1 Tax=Cupriavidus sp. HPC(L) TaxID=1217418 RepID=UPI0003BF0865|nr:AAA family ATPase [Cupriavidus sp. HPC(L)]ESJ26777.1 protein kinase [Cupriavidus sp. HPC(L)]